MNVRVFSDALLEIDGRYIEEAVYYRRKTRRRVWALWTAAACLFVVAAGAAVFPYFTERNASRIPYTQENACGFTMENSDTVYFPISFTQRKMFGLLAQNAAGLTEENRYVVSDGDLGSVMGTVGNSQDVSLVGETVYHFVKFPDSDEICIVRTNGVYQFYVKSGVEVTEEKNDFGTVTDVPVEESVGVSTAESSDSGLTLEAVTALQEQVSEAMCRGELRFVSSSAVYENPFRLHVVVSSDKQEDLEKLSAFDTTGRALEIEYNSRMNVLE